IFGGGVRRPSLRKDVPLASVVTVTFSTPAAMPRRNTVYPVAAGGAGARCARGGGGQDEQEGPGTMKSSTHVTRSYQLGGSARTARSRRNRRDFRSSSDCGRGKGP